MINETSSQMDKETPGTKDQSQANRIPQKTDALPFDTVQKSYNYIKYPEEIKMEAIERTLKAQKGVFIISPGFFFIGTFCNHYQYDSNNGHEIVVGN